MAYGHGGQHIINGSPPLFRRRNFEVMGGCLRYKMLEFMFGKH